MKLIVQHTTIVTDNVGYEKWENDKSYRPQPILKRYYLKKIILEADTLPNIGDSIVDSLWNGHSQIVSMKYFDYSDKSCCVTTTPFYLTEGDEMEKDFVKYANLHGWEVIGHDGDK